MKTDKSGEWTISQIINAAASEDFSYLYVKRDSPILGRKAAGDLEVFQSRTVSQSQLDSFFSLQVPLPHRKVFDSQGYTRFMLITDKALRSRFDLIETTDGIAIISHILPDTPEDPECIGLGDAFGDFTATNGGLYFVCSKPRSGKSTALASLIAKINSQTSKHILWVSEGTEFLFEQSTSFVSQLEVNVPDGAKLSPIILETWSPDVIATDMPLHGEFVEWLLRAAETGAKVFVCMQSPGTVYGLYTLVSRVDPDRRDDARHRLANVFERAVYIELIQGLNDIVPATEILVGIEPVRNLLREGKFEQVLDMIPAGSKYGMQTIEKSKSYLSKMELI